MYRRVKLNNFRQHRDVEIFFTPGINALKGVNEAGKSGLLEAIAYCQFGAVVGLREPLDEVVTWGEKVSTLKTEVEQELNGVIYIGRRSKAGAEVWLKDGISPLVTGQSECTKFWETVMGCSAKVAGSMMLSKQSALRGALEGGASAPVLLIETLANFKLIDTIINLVKEKIPNGHDGLTKERIAALKAQLEVPVEDGTVELQREADRLDMLLQAANHDRNLAQEACDEHAPAAKAAQEAVNALETHEQLHASLQRAETAALAATQVEVPPAPDMSKMPELRRQAADAGLHSRAVVSRRKLDAMGSADAEWDEGSEKLQAEIQRLRSDIDLVTDKRKKKELQRVQQAARVIKETQCAFCDKDLTDVPEVVTRNKELADTIAGLDGDIADMGEKLEALKGDLNDLQAVEKEARQRQPILQACAEFIKLDDKYVPARWTWTGPDTTKAVTDTAGEIATLEGAQRVHDTLKGRKEAAVAQYETAQKQQRTVFVELTELRLRASEGKPALDRAVELAAAFAQADANYRSTFQSHQTAAGALQTAQAVQRERVEARKRLAGDLLTEELNLVRLGNGNRLLKKLSGARTQVASRLWSVVLSSVSTYFSSIRGVKSVVTRDDAGFKVDGRSITGLSGSTLDALGLAIRIALTKMFLPNARFLVLDEPAAAADAERETNMIGLVATSDFDQVILVTHSDLSDSFAAQVIQL